MRCLTFLLLYEKCERWKIIHCIIILALFIKSLRHPFLSRSLQTKEIVLLNQMRRLLLTLKMWTSIILCLINRTTPQIFQKILPMELSFSRWRLFCILNVKWKMEMIMKKMRHCKIERPRVFVVFFFISSCRFLQRMPMASIIRYPILSYLETMAVSRSIRRLERSRLKTN